MSSPSAFESLFRHAPVGLARLDARCLLVDANDHFARLLGMPNEALSGRSILALEPIGRGLPPDERAAALARTCLGEAPLVWRLDEAGDEWRRLTVRPLEESGPQGTLHVASLEDVSECERARADLQQVARQLEVLKRDAAADMRARRYRDEQAALVARLTAMLSWMTSPQEMAQRGVEMLGTFLEGSRCCLSVTDAEHPAGRLVEAWQDPTLCPGGLDPFIGDPATGLLDDLGRGTSVRVRDAAADGLPGRWADELARLDTRALLVVPIVANGCLRAWLAVADDAPRDWPDEEVRFVEHVARRLWPAVQRALDERARHLLRERLEMALEAGEMGVWTWEPGARLLELSPEMRVLLGLRDEDPTLDTVLARIHPEDLPRLREAAWAGVNENRPLSVQYRVRLPDGRARWLASHGRVRRDAGGRIVGMMGVTMDISTLRALEEALREADRRKDEFLATLAHELRNPLAAISNAVQALDDDPADDLSRADRAMLVTLVGRQVLHLARLVDDLLDVARITQGKIELRPQPVDPVPLLRQAIEQVQPLMQARHQRLVLREAPERLMVRADPARFTQVMANLLNNAAKYGVPGGRVDVEMALHGQDMLEIRVRDDGIGIDPALLPRIFDLFTQADASMERTQGGLGIGLTLTRRLVEMHGGRIGAESAGLGRGSVFTLHWPALVERRAQERDPALPPVDIEMAADAVHRVLLVDDNIDSAESLAMLLQREGFDVRVAHDGGSGLRLAADLDPDVVVLDIGLPDMDGYEVARRLRMQHPAPRPRLVALTGYGSPRDRERSARAGFDAHMVKPAEVRALLAQIRRAASRGG